MFAAAAAGGSEVTFSTVMLEYTGLNPHLVIILHFFCHSFFSQKFSKFLCWTSSAANHIRLPDL